MLILIKFVPKWTRLKKTLITSSTDISPQVYGLYHIHITAYWVQYLPKQNEPVTSFKEINVEM